MKLLLFPKSTWSKKLLLGNYSQKRVFSHFYLSCWRVGFFLIDFSDVMSRIYTLINNVEEVSLFPETIRRKRVIRNNQEKVITLARLDAKEKATPQQQSPKTCFFSFLVK